MLKDIRLSMLTSQNNIPSQFKHFTIERMLRYIEEHKNMPLDVATMRDLSVVLDIIKEHFDKVSYYLFTLKTLQDKAKTNELYKVHTYINNITKRYLANSQKIDEYMQNAIESMKDMETNLRKNGFSRDKDEVRYLAATISNTQIYLDTIGVLS